MLSSNSGRLRSSYVRLSSKCISRKRLMRSVSGTGNTVGSHPHIAIVGSGPSGFYTAKYLLDKHPTIHVDLLEKLPVPYGLVRYGVAPDHPEVKNVTATFKEVAKNERFRFFGNVEITKEVQGGHPQTSPSIANKIDVATLRSRYSGVVLACGAEEDLSLGIPNEDSTGVLSARAFVNWYNGHPDYVHVGDKLDLSKVTDVVIIGHGNVAVDCARILCKDMHDLEQTDITLQAVAKLKKSTIKNVTMVGRRGVAQASFTIKELRELTKLSCEEHKHHVNIVISEEDMQRSLNEASLKEIETSRPQARMHDLMKTIVADAAAAASTNASAASPPGTYTTRPAGAVDVASAQATEQNIVLKFLLRPIQITCNTEPLPQLPLQSRALDSALDVQSVESSSVGAKVYSLHRNKTVTGIDLHKTELHGEPKKQAAKDIAMDSGDASAANANIVHLPCQLLLKSVGYRSVKLLGVPFDHKHCVVPNAHGRVILGADTGAGADSGGDAAGKDGGINEITVMLNNMLQTDDSDATTATATATVAAPINASSESNIHDRHVAPLYVVGWLKNGPKGTIATSVSDAKDTVASILTDLTTPAAADGATDGGAMGSQDVSSDPICSIPALKTQSVVNWSEYQLIETREELAGQKHAPAKPMIKVLDKKDMMMIAKKRK